MLGILHVYILHVLFGFQHRTSRKTDRGKPWSPRINAFSQAKIDPVHHLRITALGNAIDVAATVAVGGPGRMQWGGRIGGGGIKDEGRPLLVVNWLFKKRSISLNLTICTCGISVGYMKGILAKRPIFRGSGIIDTLESSNIVCWESTSVGCCNCIYLNLLAISVEGTYGTWAALFIESMRLIIESQARKPKPGSEVSVKSSGLAGISRIQTSYLTMEASTLQKLWLLSMLAPLKQYWSFLCNLLQIFQATVQTFRYY